MTDRIDYASRLIAAQPPLVYGAFATPEAYLSWLPPQGMSGQIRDWQFRDGGGYWMTLTYADAAGSPGKTADDADEVEVVFQRLIPDQRIEQLVRFRSEDEAYAGTMRMTWLFEAQAGGTHISVTCEDVPRGISPEDHQVGLASSLANLAAYVEDRA